MNFVDRLEQYMKDNNLKQIDIANMSGLSRRARSNILNGNRNTNEKLLVSLSKHSGKTINWWLNGKDEYDNLYTLNEMINLFISNGTIKEDGNIDEDTMNILTTMLKKEINVKLDAKYPNRKKAQD